MSFESTNAFAADQIPTAVLIDEMRARQLEQVAEAAPIVQVLAEHDALTPLLQLIVGHVAPFL